MRYALVAGLGGFIGSVLRFVLGNWIHRLKNGAAFPWETLVINVAGCLVIGVLAGMAESRGAFSTPARIFMVAGVLGGFTTFSAFGNDTFQLLRTGNTGAAALSVTLQVVVGTLAVWMGHGLGRLLPAE